MSFINIFADSIFPPYCLNCSKQGSWLCNKCNLKLQPSLTQCYVCRKVSKGYKTHERCSSLFHSMFIGWNYTKVSKKFMSAFKYQSAYRIIQSITPILFSRLKSNDILKDTLLIPIPLHPSRERSRGFNQAELIAKSLADKFKLEVSTDILRRVKNTKHQAYISKVDRESNIAKAFKVSNVRSGIKKILLIDDVLTTGSTMNEACLALKKYYPNTEISGLCLFRSTYRRNKMA